MATFIFVTHCPRREGMENQMSLSTGSLHPQMDASTSDPTIHLAPRADLSGACRTEQEVSPLERTTCRRNSATWPRLGRMVTAMLSSIPPPSPPGRTSRPGDITAARGTQALSGVLDSAKWIYQKFGMKVMFKSRQSLRSLLTKVKDPLTKKKQATVVYLIPCSCNKAYIGETVRRREARVMEHQVACQKGTLQKSALAEHAWESHHLIKWKDVTVIDRTRTV